MSIWQGLLANLGVVCLIIAVWSYLGDWYRRFPPAVGVSVESLLAACGVLAVMSIPFPLGPGLVADLRSTVIALSGFVAGPVVAVAAAPVAVAYRLWIGGAGAVPSIAGALVALAAGIGGHRLLEGRSPRERDILLLAVVTACAPLASYIFLAPELKAAFDVDRVLTIAALVFIATAAGGLTVIAHLRERTFGAANLTYRAITDALPDSLNAKDLAGRFIAANPATADLLQAGSSENLFGKTDFDFFPPDVALGFRRTDEKVVAKGVPEAFERLIPRRDGSVVRLAPLKVPLRDPSGRVIGLVTHNRDITEQKRLEAAHAAAQERLSAALAHMADALVMFDAHRRIVLCNDQHPRMFPITADLRVPGRLLADILHAAVEREEETGVAPQDVDDWVDRICASLKVAGDREIELADGRRLHIRVRPIGDGSSLSVISDVTAQRDVERALSVLNTRLAAMARTDALTGLVNRRGFDEALNAEMGRVRRTGTSIGFILVDVDHFKAFNDTYGHPSGDACLQAVADCLKSRLRRQGDVVARYGSEEFAAILPDASEAGILHVATGLREAVAALGIDHRASSAGFVTVSIGVSMMPPEEAHAEDAVPLVERADRALYNAKAAGRNCVRSEWLRTHGSGTGRASA